MKKAAKNVKQVLVFELNLGQMVEDVKLALDGSKPVDFMGRVGGLVYTPQEIKEKIQEYL